MDFIFTALEVLNQGAESEKLSDLIVHIEILRYRFFHELNPAAGRGKGTSYRAATKVIGFLYGQLLGRIRQQKLIIRQYCRLGRTCERVS